MGQKDRILRKLGRERLLQLAVASSGGRRFPYWSVPKRPSNEMDESALIAMVKESMSVEEIRRRLKIQKVQDRRRYHSALALVALVTILGVSFIPVNSFMTSSLSVNTTPPEVEWSREYGLNPSTFGTIDNDLQRTSDGGYVLAGYNYTGGILIIKVDQDGFVQWSRTYGGEVYGIAYSIKQTSDQGYIIAGSCIYYNVSGNFIFIFDEVYMVRTDEYGNLQWSRTYRVLDNSYAYDVRQTADGGYIVAGMTGNNSGSTSALLLRIDSEGALLWSMTYGTGSVAYSVLEAPDEGYIFAGRSPIGVAWLLRTNQYGKAMWNKTCVRSLWSEAHCIEATSDGGYIIGGRDDSIDYSPGSEAFVVKTDQVGNAYWAAFYRESYYNCAVSVHETNNGGFAVGGYAQDYYFSGSAMWILKIDGNGGKLWNKTLNGYGYAIGGWIQVTPDDGYVVAGTSNYYGSAAMLILELKLPVSVAVLLYGAGVVAVPVCIVSLVFLGSRGRKSRRRNPVSPSRASMG
ncbi:MAG: hypothetical protein WED04_06925 [Promethearchaeati archaeon SRVP18_Atabeyarchaeia-1]